MSTRAGGVEPIGSGDAPAHAPTVDDLERDDRRRPRSIYDRHPELAAVWTRLADAVKGLDIRTTAGQAEFRKLHAQARREEREVKSRLGIARRPGWPRRRR